MSSPKDKLGGYLGQTTNSGRALLLLGDSNG